MSASVWLPSVTTVRISLGSDSGTMFMVGRKAIAAGMDLCAVSGFKMACDVGCKRAENKNISLFLLSVEGLLTTCL